QARGQTTDHRTDIFSLGVVIFEMVAGRPPFEGSSPSEVMAAIMNQEPPLLARYSRKTPAELERIVSKALQKDREESYQRAKGLLIDLKNLKLELELEAKLGRERQMETRGNIAVETTVERGRDETSERQTTRNEARSTARNDARATTPNASKPGAPT